MALFGDKKKTGKQETAKSAQSAERGVAVHGTALSDVLIRPRITEKATRLAERNIYTFEIMKGANKQEVAKAVEQLYSVTPVKVAIVSGKQKNVVVRGRRGKRASIKKAYVYLKEGDRIELV